MEDDKSIFSVKMNRSYDFLYEIVKNNIEKELHKVWMSEEFQNRTFLPKEFKNESSKEITD